MCGIICAINSGKDALPVNEEILLQFEDQESRGTKGFGIIKIKENGEYKVDRSTEGFKFMWDIHSDKVTKMIVHHRYPTSSDNKIKQTHPILVDNNSLKFKYLLVHNGVISNDDEVKESHEKLGFVYTTNDGAKFNDSECLAISIARFIENQITLVETEGSAAFICLQINKKTNKATKLFFGRNDRNPLKMAKTRGKLFLSSEGKGAEIEPFFLYECKLDEEMKLSKRKMKFFEKPVVTEPSKLSWRRDDDYREDIFGRGKYKDYHAKSFYDNYGGGIAPFDNEAERTYYQKLDKEAVDEYDETELSEIDVAVETSATTIQAEIDRFMDLLYDRETVKYMGKDDVNSTLESIKELLEDSIKEAKEAHMAVMLKADGLPVSGA